MNGLGLWTRMLLWSAAVVWCEERKLLWSAVVVGWEEWKLLWSAVGVGWVPRESRGGPQSLPPISLGLRLGVAHVGLGRTDGCPRS